MRRNGSRWKSPNSIFLDGGEATLRLLHALRGLGVRIALDDFGTGYSSLSYLQSFPFDKLKIDRSFIQNLLTRDGASAIVRAITELAHALNIETTAEGVEETAQLMELRAHGCSSVQGFLFAEPMTGGGSREAVPRRRRRASERRLIAAPLKDVARRSDRLRCTPVSAIATRISASISFSTCATPASPRAGERIGPRPAEQDEVGAKREHPHDVESERTPPSASTGSSSGNGVGNRAASARALDSTPSSWRPPWLETTIPSAPLAAASRASSGSSMPLITSGPCHCERTHSTSFQVTLASKLLATQPIKSASAAPEPTSGSRLPMRDAAGRAVRRPTPSPGRRSTCAIRLAGRRIEPDRPER